MIIQPALKNTPAFVMTRYVGWRFALRMIGILLGLSALLLIFDTMANADDILTHHNKIVDPLFTYMVLRAPAIAALVLPLCVLLGLMRTFAKLVASQELVAMRAAGISVYRLMTLFLLATAIIAFGHFLLINAVLPKTQTQLKNWAAHDYQDTPGMFEGESNPRWIKTGDFFLHVGMALENGRVLKDVDLIERNSDGGIKNYQEIEEARFDGMRWHIKTSDGLRLTISLPLTPPNFETLKADPSELGYGALMQSLWNENGEDSALSDPAQRRLNQLWLEYKLAQPLAAFIMLVLAAPLALQISRRGHMMRSGTFILISGCGYLLAGQLFLSLGEAGYLPVFLAAWGPALIFLSLGFWVLLLREG